MQAKIGEKFLKGTEVVSFEQISKNKLYGVYFSARWCPPCKLNTLNVRCQLYADIS